MCCMLNTFLVSSRRVANISGPSFSSPNSSLGLAGGKYCQEIIIPIFSFVLHNFATPGYLPYRLSYRYLFSLLSSCMFITVCGSAAVRELFKSYGYCKLMSSCCLQWQVTLMGALNFHGWHGWIITSTIFCLHVIIYPCPMTMLVKLIPVDKKEYHECSIVNKREWCEPLVIICK